MINNGPTPSVCCGTSSFSEGTGSQPANKWAAAADKAIRRIIVSGRLGPCWSGGFETTRFAGERVGEGQPPRMQAHRRVLGQQCLGFAEHAAGKINGVAHDRQVLMPEMDADLVGASGSGSRFDQARAVFELSEQSECGCRPGASVPNRRPFVPSGRPNQGPQDCGREWKSWSQRDPCASIRA